MRTVYESLDEPGVYRTYPDGDEATLEEIANYLVEKKCKQMFQGMKGKE